MRTRDEEGGPPGAETCKTTHLLRAAQAGDRAALEELFSRYLPRVRQIVAMRSGRRLRQLADVDDIVQESLIKVFMGLHRFEERSDGGFRNWLSRCVECEIKDHLRRAKAKKRGAGKLFRFADCPTGMLHSSIFAGKRSTPSEMARAVELEEKIETALISLPESCREVIILRKLCGMSFKEIAATMGLAQEAGARMALSRAMDKLKEKLTEKVP